MKPKVLHIIDSFSKGGAEVLLAGIVPELNDYEHIILYLTPTKFPLLSADLTNIKIECLNFQGIFDIPAIVKKINQFIETENPSIIHTHLYFSSIFVRFANIRQAHVIQTYHGAYYRMRYVQLSARIKKNCMKLIDRFTMKKSYTIIHVSKSQQQVNDYDVKIKSSNVYYNYVENVFFQERKAIPFDPSAKLKIISVGNLKTEKNHILLLQALKQLKHLPMHVNICGEGNDHKMLQKYINKNNLPVTILGSKNNIKALLDQHDLFISCSIIEGFGISIAEAMASEIPMIISDISTFKEITQGKAVFFESQHAQSLARNIEAFYFSPEHHNQSVADCKKIACQYKKSFYINTINTLYKRIGSNK